MFMKLQKMPLTCKMLQQVHEEGTISRTGFCMGNISRQKT